MLDILNLECRYENDLIFSNLTIKNINSGMTFIKGRSGCGKSSLIKFIMGINPITKGKILFNNAEIKDFSKFREEYISIVFQDNMLVDYYTVKENLMLITSDEAKIKKALDKVHLLNKINTYPQFLSGGERQRINIVRALLKGSLINIFDEPTSSVNSSLKVEIMDLISTLFKDKINIIISHNNELINRYADRIIDIEKNEDKIIHMNDEISITKTKYNPPIFKLTIRSYKKRNLMPFAVVSLVLLIVLTSLSLFKGIDGYIDYNLKKKIDYNYFYLNDFNDELLEDLNDKYTIELVNNYQNMLNMNYRDKILIGNNKVLDYFEIKVYDGIKKILINKYFFDFKKTKKLFFNGKTFETDVIDDGSLYTSPTIYFSYDFLYSEFGNYNCDKPCFKTNNYKEVYDYLNNKIKNKFSIDIKENDIYFDNSTIMINNSLGPFLNSIHGAVLLLSYSIIIMAISFIITLINYNIKMRKDELYIYRNFGLKNINLIVIYEAFILVFFSLFISLILFFILAPFLNHLIASFLGEFYPLILPSISSILITFLLSFVLVLISFYGNRFKKDSQKI